MVAEKPGKGKNSAKFRAITRHNLGKCPAAPLGLLRLEGGEQQGGQLVGQSNRLHGGLHSASPQHLADRSLIRILGNS